LSIAEQKHIAPTKYP